MKITWIKSVGGANPIKLMEVGNYAYLQIKITTIANDNILRILAIPV